MSPGPHINSWLPCLIGVLWAQHPLMLHSLSCHVNLCRYASYPHTFWSLSVCGPWFIPAEPWGFSFRMDDKVWLKGKYNVKETRTWTPSAWKSSSGNDCLNGKHAISAMRFMNICFLPPPQLMRRLVSKSTRQQANQQWKNILSVTWENGWRFSRTDSFDF